MAYETPTPTLCEWCRQRKPVTQRKIGKRPKTKLPLILHLCQQCADEKAVAKEDDE